MLYEKGYHFLSNLKMYFNKNLKLLIKELRIHKDIIKFKNNVISNYNNKSNKVL